MLEIDRSQQPLTIDPVKKILFDGLCLEVDFLHNDMSDGCVLDNLHLLGIIKYQRIKILSHEEVVCLPFAFPNRLLNLSIPIDRQRKMNAFTLQFPVCCEVEEEIIK